MRKKNTRVVAVAAVTAAERRNGARPAATRVLNHALSPKIGQQQRGQQTVKNRRREQAQSLKLKVNLRFQGRCA